MKRSALPLSAWALAGALGCGLFAPTAFAQTKWDLAAAYPATNFHTENLAEFAKDVDTATGGKLKITVHANASLFKANEIKRAVQGGQAPAGEILLPNFENENPIFGVDGIPFLATSYADSKRLYEAQKPVLEKLLNAQGLRLLYTVAWPPQGIYSKRKSPRWRICAASNGAPTAPPRPRSPSLIGAQPVTIQAAELSQATATGAVESMMTSGSTGYDSKLYESIKYFYDTQAWLPKNAIIVSKKAFDALDKPTQYELLKSAAAAEARGWKISAEKNEWYKKALTDKGMKILPPPPKLVADLRQVGDIMLADWLKKAGPDGEAIIAAYRKPAPAAAQ